jgi:hypothetical protein
MIPISYLKDGLILQSEIGNVLVLQSQSGEVLSGELRFVLSNAFSISAFLLFMLVMGMLFRSCFSPKA